MYRRIFHLIIILVCCITTFSSLAQTKKIPELKEMTKYSGYFDFYYSESEDKIYLHVDKLDSQFLYVSSLSQGVGSNDLGLDRGQLGSANVVFFQKKGSKLMLTVPNLDYRAVTDNELERRSVEQAFAKSVLFGFPIVDTTDSGYLINFSPFLLQDVHDVGGKLKAQKQGAYSIDLSRSALSLDQTKAFPKNVEFEALITLKGNPAGKEIRSVTPVAKYVSVYQHHSFIELPDHNYTPRKHDPRCGVYPLSFMDYGSPIDQNIVTKFIERHRLEKKNPLAALSEAVDPIIYYLDNGTPEPVRSALLDGARWWNQAFEAIGYKDAFQVRMLPDDADPMDVRYNVIQWVHRSTRGWSYGGSVSDPRTGEIIKGHVSLGSLRVRQDFLIAQALSNAPFKDSDDNTAEMLEMALARIRQLAAHEVGHTLGFEHNFAASTNDRASVMDYPHPLVELNNNKIDFSNAYAVGIGEWDKITVAYAYGVYINEETALKTLLDNAEANGFRYVSDQDARDPGGCNPYGHLWDNGVDPVDELHRVMKVRDYAINQFSIHNIRSGEGSAKLEDVFVPLYFFHRYQTEAAVKLIGGIDYTYGVKGESLQRPKIVKREQQWKALQAMLLTISPTALTIPRHQLELFSPRGWGSRTRESINSSTGPAFDPIGAATTAANYTFNLLLHPSRASRLVEQSVYDSEQLSLSDVIDELMSYYSNSAFVDPLVMEVKEAIHAELLSQLMSLAQNPNTYAHVGSVVDEKLAIFMRRLKKKKDRTVYEDAYLHDLHLYFEDPSKVKVGKVLEIPAGSPIGSGCSFE